jgi:hypothetical protein
VNNLKKFTKAELISKLRSKDHKINDVIIKTSIIERIKTWSIKIWEFIVKIFNILMKISLLRLAFKSIKHYSWIKRFWKVINGIILGIFGISLIDNFGWEVFSDCWREIKLLTWKTTDYLTSTRFYNWLEEFWKPSIAREIPSSRSMEQIKSEIESETSRNDKSSWQNNRNNSKISDWLKPEPEPQTDPEISYGKYIIIAGVLFIGGCLAYYYSDEIIANANSLWESIKNFRRDNDPGDDGNIGSARIELERLAREHGERNNSIENNEEVVTVYPENIPKIKVHSPPLTSPSFDDLSSKAEESWATSSSSSTETIKPYSSTDTSSKIKLDAVFPLKDEAETSKEVIENNPFNTENKLFKDKLEDIKFWTSTWRSILPSETSDMINFVEKINKLPISELTKTTEMSRVDMFAKIIFQYNEQIDHLKTLIDPKDLEINKNLLFELRRWIRDNHSEILPSLKDSIKLGSHNDIPTPIKIIEIIGK